MNAPLEIYADHCHGAGHCLLSFVLFGKLLVVLEALIQVKMASFPCDIQNNAVY